MSFERLRCVAKLSHVILLQVFAISSVVHGEFAGRENLVE